jgi:hypothetical protein
LDSAQFTDELFPELNIFVFALRTFDHSRDVATRKRGFTQHAPLKLTLPQFDTDNFAVE